jgi:hypothetical protein
MKTKPKNPVLFEYVTSGDYRSPDCTTVEVDAYLLEEAINYHIEGMGRISIEQELANYMYEDAYAKTQLQNPDPHGWVASLVQNYLKDTT